MPDRRGLFLAFLAFNYLFLQMCLFLKARSFFFSLCFFSLRPFLSAFVSVPIPSLSSVSSLPLISSSRPSFSFLFPSSEDGLHTEWRGKWARREARPARRSQTKRRAANWQFAHTYAAPLIEGKSAGALRWRCPLLGNADASNMTSRYHHKPAGKAQDCDWSELPNCVTVLLGRINLSWCKQTSITSQF